MGWVRGLSVQMRAVLFGGALSVAASACGHAAPPPPVAPPPRLPEAKPRAPRPPAPAEWYWQPVAADIHTAPRKALTLPVPEASIVKNDAAWNALSADAKTKLRTYGVVVNGNDSEVLTKSATSLGAFYTEMSEAKEPGKDAKDAAGKTPLLITVDALFAATRLGLELSLAQAEELLAPALDALLSRLEKRLAAEQKGVGATLSEAYRLARGIIAVAGNGKPPPDLAAAVNAERALIDAHAVTATSPVLGFPIDYTRFAVPSASGRPASFRALAWLGSVPLPLVARAEQPGAPLDVSQARMTTRAAMILARLVDAEIDAESNALYTRIGRFLAFAWGTSDDLTLAQLDELGTKAGVDLTKPEHIIDVAKVDKIRFGAMKTRAPLIYDGPGGMGRTARVFGGHASPDSIALTTLLGAHVGAAQEGAPPSIQREGLRVVPSTLDIGAWLGAPGAKAALKETRADAFADFDAALNKLTDERDIDAFHSSIYESLVAATGALAAEAEPGPPSRLESMLSAWTITHHIDQPFAHAKPNALRTSAPAESATPILVENAPETIARLLATVRQTKRGFEAQGFPVDSLTAIDDLLRIALTGAEHRANDVALSSEEKAKIATLPARIAALEEDTGTDTHAIASVVATDPPSRRVLITAIGRIEPLYELTRDIGRDEPILVVGPHFAHHEIVTDAGEAPTDAAWRGKVVTASRASYTAGFRVLPPSRVSQ